MNLIIFTQGNDLSFFIQKINYKKRVQKEINEITDRYVMICKQTLFLHVTLTNLYTVHTKLYKQVNI